MKKKQWFVEICEAEGEINVFRNADAVIDYIKGNDPSKFGTVELDSKDAPVVAKHFRSKNVATVGLSWNKYAGQLGLDPI